VEITEGVSFNVVAPALKVAPEKAKRLNSAVSALRPTTPQIQIDKLRVTGRKTTRLCIVGIFLAQL